MQKLWLKNFEFHINPATWNIAQDLVQAGAVRNLREVEKHFWVSLVIDGDSSYEVEAIITPHKIKAFTCECWAEGRRLMCAHIAATLFKVRQFLDQQNEARQIQISARQSEETGKLTVQSVLDQASPDELVEFVRAYSRRDRDFALALKSWFAGSIDGADNPFSLLLDSTLPRHAGTRPLREPELRRLRKILDDLETQIGAAANQGNARTVYQIATAVLQKVSLLLAKAEENRRDQLVHYCRSALQQLIQLHPDQLSPELQENRRNFLLDYAMNDRHPTELERNLVQFLGQVARDDRFFGQIRDLFDRTPYPAPPVMLHLFLTALAMRNIPEAVQRVLEDYIEQPARIRDALVVLYYLNCWTAVLVAGDHFLGKGLFNTGQRRELEDLLLLAAEKANDPARQRRYLRNRYRETGHAEVFHRLKTLAGADWHSEQEQLAAELMAAGHTERLAPLLAAEGKLDALAQLLQDKKNLNLLQQFEHLYWPERKNFVLNQYVTLLAGYLSEHFGRQASGYVREQLAGLLRKGQTELVLEIIRALTKQFEDRHTLPEELAELFPKSKKRSLLLPGE